MTPAKEVSITIGQIKVKIGDLRGFVDSNIILANGMKIKASEIEIQTAKKAVADRAKQIVEARQL